MTGRLDPSFFLLPLSFFHPSFFLPSSFFFVLFILLLAAPVVPFVDLRCEADAKPTTDKWTMDKWTTGETDGATVAFTWHHGTTVPHSTSITSPAPALIFHSRSLSPS